MHLNVHKSNQIHGTDGNCDDNCHKKLKHNKHLFNLGQSCEKLVLILVKIIVKKNRIFI